MSQRITNDIEALRTFRNRLIAFNRDLAEGLSVMRGSWRDLGDVWRDDLYRQFGDALDEVTPGIDRYLATTEHHEAHLQRLIQRLQDYLDESVG